MARPRSSEKEAMATAKIENAFWRLLEAGPYAEITVLRISQESGTNRNSFYYHYKNIDDLAYKAFVNDSGYRAAQMLISRLLSAFQNNGGAALVFEPDVLSQTKRVMLYAGSESYYLNSLAKTLLKDIWFDALSIQEELLTMEEKLQINFIFAGLIAILGSREIKDSPLYMSILFQTELGQALVAALKNISLSQMTGGAEEKNRL